MKAGDLREYVTLIKRGADTVDEYGRVRQTWHELCKLPAQVADVSSRDFYDAAAHGLQDVVTITTRWMDGITTYDRVRHDGVVYDIMEVNHLGYRRDFIRLKCRRQDHGKISD